MKRLAIAIGVLLFSLFSLSCTTPSPTRDSQHDETWKMHQRHVMPPAFGGQYGGK